MADRLNNLSSSYYPYVNYWRPSISQGTTLFRSRSSTITDKFDVRHKWQIIPIATCVIITVTLVIGIYNAVKYQNSSATVFLTTTSETTTTTTTTAPITSKVAAITTTITTLAVDTTSAAVSTDAVTTKTPPICPSMLPFGDDAGDMKSTSILITRAFPSFNLADKTIENGHLKVYTTQGAVKLTTATSEELQVNMFYRIPSTREWSVYYRNISSKADQDAIACLVNDFQHAKAFVATWIRNNVTELQAFQFIIAVVEQSATYIIRIYSENLPESSVEHQVQIHYGSEDADLYYFADAKVKDVAGQRQIFDVSKKFEDGQNLTVVEEGKNCDIFIC